VTVFGSGEVARGSAVFDWNDLKVFLAAHRCGTIGRAAQALGVSGSTVSRRLSALEDALGESLFVRSPDGLIATEAGRRAWEAAEEAERLLERVEANVASSDGARGKVRVSVSTEVLHGALLPVWNEFASRHPEISVDFVESTGLADLERWEADIAIRAVRPTSQDNLVITRVRDTVASLFGAPTLLRQHGIDPDDAVALEAAAARGWSELPFVDWSDDHAHLGIAQLRAAVFANAPILLRASNLETLRLAAAAGVGLVLLPRFFGLLSPRLRQLPAPKSMPPAQPVFLVGHAAIRNVPRVDAVWRFLDQRLRGTDEDDLVGARADLNRAYGVTFEDA